MATASAGGAKSKISISDLGIDAGIRVEPTEDPEFKETKDLALAKNFRSRPDPFSLLAIEQAFEKSQSRERVFSEIAGWTTMFTPPEEKPDEEEILEPPPTGIRLSGIILSQGVVALLEYPGKPGAIDIRPGTKIPDTEWTVVSIDLEKAILRRTSNKQPKQIVVLLQNRLDGGQPATPGNTGGAGNPFGGGPPSGAPYGPGRAPGGFPGGAGNPPGADI